QPVGAEHALLAIDDEVVAQPDARAGEEAREVRERRRIEEEEDPAPALQVAGELVELREEEVVLRSGYHHQVRLRRYRSVEQRVALGDVVLRREGSRQAAVALRATARRPLAVADRERDVARLPAQRAQDAARQLLLGHGRRDRPSAGVFDRRPPVLRDAEGARPIGVAVEVVELELDLAVEDAQALEQLGVLLARPAPEEDRQAQRLLHLGEELLRDRRERELAARRQVEAVVGPLRHDLEEPET